MHPEKTAAEAPMAPSPGRAILLGIARRLDQLNFLLGRLSALVIVVILLLLSYDVIMRYVFRRPADWVLDVTQLAQATLAFVSASYVLKVGGHVNMNMVTEYLSNQWRRRFAIAASLITVLGSAWMAILSWSLFSRSLRIREAAYGIDIPLYPWKLLVSFCFALLAIQAFAMLIENILAGPEKFEELAGEL